jgi:hypothetical protein
MSAYIVTPLDVFLDADSQGQVVTVRQESSGNEGANQAAIESAQKLESSPCASCGSCGLLTVNASWKPLLGKQSLDDFLEGSSAGDSLSRQPEPEGAPEKPQLPERDGLES